ncbi:hypothetical protein AB0E94_51675, partial [Actinoplanes sp. NPDC026670]
GRPRPGGRTGGHRDGRAAPEPAGPVEAPPPVAPAEQTLSAPQVPVPAPAVPALSVAPEWAEQPPEPAPVQVPAATVPVPAVPPQPVPVPPQLAPPVQPTTPVPLPVAPSVPVPPPLAPSALSPVELTTDLPAVDTPAPASPAGTGRPAGNVMSGPAPAPSVPQPEEPGPATAAEPAQRPRPRLQPVPDRAASALLAPGRAPTEERAWLRRTLSREYDLVATTVSRVLAQHPVLQGGDDALTDAVALRLYLSAKGRAIDAALRAARKGPHVPLARCAVAGLTRLPSHRGPTWTATTLTGDRWALLAGRTMLTEWGFLNALTEPSADLTGDTDVLIWAMTARRTALLEPDDGDHADNRVLFLPGTSFKVLERAEPSGGRRGRLLLREVSPNEINPDGRVQDNRASFDDLATRSLTGYATRRDDADQAARVGESARERFRAVPGLSEPTEENR